MRHTYSLSALTPVSEKERYLRSISCSLQESNFWGVVAAAAVKAKLTHQPGQTHRHLTTRWDRCPLPTTAPGRHTSQQITKPEVTVAFQSTCCWKPLLFGLQFFKLSLSLPTSEPCEKLCDLLGCFLPPCYYLLKELASSHGCFHRACLSSPQSSFFKLGVDCDSSIRLQRHNWRRSFPNALKQPNTFLFAGKNPPPWHYCCKKAVWGRDGPIFNMKNEAEDMKEREIWRRYKADSLLQTDWPCSCLSEGHLAFL